MTPILPRIGASKNPRAVHNVKVASYRVLRNGWWLYRTVNASTTAAGDASTVPGNTYTYIIQAVDQSGNVSASRSVTITIH